MGVESTLWRRLSLKSSANIYPFHIGQEGKEDGGGEQGLCLSSRPGLGLLAPIPQGGPWGLGLELLETPSELCVSSPTACSLPPPTTVTLWPLGGGMA